MSPAPELFACAEQAMRAKRYSEADGICRDILQTQPGFAAALGLRGLVAAIEGDTARAIALLEAALAGQPGNAALRSALSDAYRLCGRLDEALALAQAVVRQAPRQAAFRINLAKVHHDRGDLDRGASEFLAALAMEPENANAHLGLGQILLSREQYRPGWIEYEWRNKIEHVLSKYKGLNAAMWNGMPLRDDRILLIGDQGYGDTLQFSRYIPMVAARCREVAVGCAAELVPLLGKMDGVGIAHARWTDIPGFTAYALLSSLPYIFGTDEVTIPSGLPYLHADAARIAHWRTRLDEAAPRGRRVGLFWSGRQSHPNNTRRSMPLSTLRGLADLPGFVPVSLQKEWPGDCRQDSMPGLVRFDAELTDFGETAALIHNLDLVVSVDSAVVHLAGAMGRPAWLMAATPADWRWLLGRSDSPWYPSIRIFRQTKAGEWDGVIDAIKEAWPPP